MLPAAMMRVVTGFTFRMRRHDVAAAVLG